MLFEPQPTAFDLRFRLFGTPVRIHPFFWVFSAILGWGAAQNPDNPRMLVPTLLVWIACVFVSILVHEMGHIVMGRLFGAHGYVVLYSFGGLAVGSKDGMMRRWQRVLVSFAGPLAGFLLLGFVVGLLFLLPRVFQVSLVSMPSLVLRGLDFLIFINLFWGLLNLLPIWPLDGGQISREVLEGAMPANGTRTALGLSLVIAGLLAVNALAIEYGRPLLAVPILNSLGGWWAIILFTLLALGSWQTLQAAEAEQRHWDDRWER